MRNIISDYARLLRLPGLGGLSVAPVFGAISVGIYDIKTLSLIYLIGVFSAIYGFVLNDYVDVEVDKLSKDLINRPLVKGTISKNIALFICVICVIGAFAIIFLFFYKNNINFYLGILSIILSAVLGSIYDLFGKKFFGSDILVALSEALLVLFGAFIVLENVTINFITWIIFILTFNDLLYMNAVDGGLKDIDHDYLKAVKNIALTSGVKVTKNKTLFIPLSFKAFGLGLRIFSAIILFIPFIFYSIHYEIWQVFLLALFIVFVLFLSVRFLTLKKFDRKQIRKLIVSQAFLSYSLVPLMIIPFIGLISTIILMLFPFIWYVIFTPLIGGKLFQPVF